MARMSKSVCPACSAALPAEQINVAQGIAFCGSCGKLSRLDEVLLHADFDRHLQRVPDGCSIIDDGRTIHVRASLRSIGGALGMLAIALFWNGIVSVFVLLAIAGLWFNLVGPLPAGLPDPEMNGEPMSLGMTIFLCIFLIPFITVGAGMIGMMLMYLRGRIDIRIDDEKGTIRTGIGLVGWTRRFDPKAVTKVTIGETSWQENDRHKPLIRIDADDTIKFGSSLTEVRRDWLRAVLQVLLLMPDAELREQILNQGERSWELRGVKGS